MRTAIVKYCLDFFSRHQKLEHYVDIFSNQYYKFTTRPFKLIDPANSRDYVPVIINNFNRLHTLKILIEWLLSGSNKVFIIILDNQSTYPPLLDYYKSLNHKDIYLRRFNFNWGTRMILPVSKSLHKFDHYIVTDADLIPGNMDPSELLMKMKEVLALYPDYNHVGASLEINDLPDYYPLKSKVLEWESKFWKEKVDDCYVAEIDTTFAMYSRKSNPRLRNPALRLDRPYTFRHADWYIDPENISEEYKFYIAHCNKTASWAFEMMRKQDIRKLLKIDKNRMKAFKSYY